MAEGVGVIERVPHSVAVFGQVTAAGFPRRCTHAIYRMTCADYDVLEARADGRCEICGVESDRLVIDHDHAAGEHAVRGLVCSKCNSLMAGVDAGKREADERVVRYLARPFQTEHRPYADRERPNDLWSRANRVADRRGENLAEVIRRALERYVEEGDKK